MKRTAFLIAFTAALPLVLGSCGGSGGGGEETPPVEQVGVFSGFNDSGNLNWESTGGGDGGTGDGGADGDGGVGAGGDFGQFRGAQVCVFLDSGAQLGCALTDNLKGMVTIKPGRSYQGGLRLELRGTPTASYYEEGRDAYVAFPPDRVIRTWIPRVQRNIGITPFTEAAYRLLTEGSTPERATGTPTPAQIRAANEKVRELLNQQFPSALHVDDIARLPFIKLQGLAPGSIGIDQRGRYGLVNGAFSKQASAFHGDSATPTLDAVRQLSEDLLDGQLDGRNGDRPVVSADKRTYDPHTLTSELSSALAEQASRFGAQAALDSLPKVLNFGNVRYEGYLFDGSISKEGSAFSTVAGWVADNTRGFGLGQAFNRLPGRRALAFYGNNGHGGGFYKVDALGPRHKIFAIGDNVNGELGLGTREPTRGQAVEITLPGALTHAAGGFAHTVVRLANGEVYAWGDNSYGQLGQGQDAGTLPNSLVPLRVSLPLPAVAAAATNVASYALLEDGTVWAWGSNGGFALLGNGTRNGMATAPTQVAGLTGVVQINARDNDVVVVKADNTVWHWGSFPADEDALQPGDVGGAYRGGTLQPVQVQGLPAGVQVRKVLTEQGLFAALLGNGHVYHWGVHFDITAQAVLRDLQASRVFALPPVRDLMPGGFVGYGVRPFDRLTAMAIDYSGGMWKIRGRVAERFDPANPQAQRRPPGAARPDCENCHTFLDQTIEQLRALQPSTAGMPVCEPPPNVHAPGGASLIHAETECIFCHNPSRANYPTLAQPFAASGFWPNCSPPTNLAPRTSSNPPLLTNSCTIPAGHAFTPPGTVCASCHNSIIARPLQSLNPPCAQPLSAELPTIPATASITGAFTAPGGVAIAANSTTATRRHELRGTLSNVLAAGQSLQVLRNGSAAGNATVNGTTWSFTFAADAADGTLDHAVRVVNASGGFGITSHVLRFTVDGTAPAAQASIGGFVDDVLGAVAAGGFASDTTPGLQGTLSTPLAAGETVQVLRDGAVVGTADVSGTAWTFTEPTALPDAAYSYSVRSIDAVGNITAGTAAATLNVVTTLAATTILQVTNDASAVIAPGGTTSDATPGLAGTVSAALPAGHVVRVRRNGTALGTATVTGTSWTFTEPGAPEGPAGYSARVEAGAVLGAEASYSITIDTVPPTQVAAVTGIADDFNGALANGGTTADATPTVSGTLSAALAAGEQVRVLRNGVQAALLSPAGTAWSFSEAAPLPGGTYTYQAQVVDAAGLTSALGVTTRSVVVDLAAVPLQNAATTLATINGVAPSGGAVPANTVTTPVLAGALQRALNGGEVVRVYRGGAAVGNANVTGTSWSYTNTALADGSYSFFARIEVAGVPTTFGQPSATVSDPIDTTAPTQVAAVTSIFDNSGGLVSVGGAFTSDTTPRVDGTISPALGAGESVRILRNGSLHTTLSPAAGATSWSFVSTALAAGQHSFSAQLVDAAGNLGPTSGAQLAVTVVTSMSSATIASMAVSGTGSFGKPNGTAVASGGAIPDLTPTATISISPALPAGHLVRLLRDGVSVGTASGCGSSCSVTDSGVNQTQGSHSYTARVEAGVVLGNLSSAHSLVVDTVDPPVPSISAVANNRPFQNTLSITTGDVAIGNGGSTGDPDPRITMSFNGALGANEQAILYRNGTSVVMDSTTTIGANSLVADQPAVLTRPTSTPSPTSNTAVVYTARRIDAAGNLSEATFTINYRHQLCDSARAVSIGGANGTHNAAGFPAGGLTCVTAGCHTNETTAGGFTFLAAPRAFPGNNSLGQSDWYWCRRN